MTSENWGLLGHEWAVEMLKQHLVRNSVRHAYLFCGPPGLGRRTLALRFAQALNCLNPPVPGEPCGTCKTCQQIERMQYPDLTVIQADKEGGSLKVELIRELRQSLSLKPYQGSFRVALLLRFQEATVGAANALLKTLEEAPAHAVLLLTADTPEQLPPTIPSRCEILRLRSLPVERVELFLKENGAEGAKAHLLAHLSGGRPGYALRLMQDQEALEFRSRRLAEIQKLLKSTRRERFAYAEKLTEKKYQERERLHETLLLWLAFWRDVLMQVAGSDAPLVNVDYRSEIEAMASRLSLPAARQLVNTAEGAVEWLEKNVNARLLAENLLLDWPKIA
jgi:DNA polymerase III subunit delta'